MNRIKAIHHRLLVSASIAALTLGGAAFAQDNTTSEEDDGARRLETITVTSKKRETTLEDTTGAISVVSGDKINSRNLVEITELFNVVPGVTFNQPPAGLPAPTIRGIGTNSANQTFEQSVGLFVDGVFKPRASQYTDAFFDVERVEIIRGGQGAIFGKNTSVGAISIVSRRPGDTFGGEVSASYEPVFDSGSVGLTVDLPASDTLKFRFGGEYIRTGGFVENTVLDRDESETDRWIVRGTGEYDPAGPFSARFMGQFSSRETEGTPFQALTRFDDPGSLFVAGLFGLPDPENFVKTTNGDLVFPDGTVDVGEFVDNDSFDLVLTLGYDLGDLGDLTSISSYSDFTFESAIDSFQFVPVVPFPPTPTGGGLFNEDFQQFTQEFRHNFESDRFRLTSGAFFQYQEFVFDLTAVLSNIFVPAGPLAGGNIAGSGTATLDHDLWSASVFTQASYDLTDRFTIEAAVRVGREEKDGDFVNTVDSLVGLAPPNPLNFAEPGTSIFPITNGPGAISAEINDTTIDGSVTLSYDVTDDILFFTSISQGTKSGGFNNAGPLPVPFVFDEEVARAAEVGLKGTFLNGAGYFSAVGFYTDIEDFQDSVFDANAGAAGTGAFVTQSLDAENFGFEAEARYQLTDDIVIGGSIAFLDAESTETGGTLARAPDFTSSFSVDFDRDVTQKFALQAGGLLVTNSGFLHRQTPIGAPPLPVNEAIDTGGAFQLLDLYAGFRHLQSGMQFRVEVKNVTDEVYTTFAFPQPLFQTGLNGSLNRPRTVTLGVSVPFGGG